MEVPTNTVNGCLGSRGESWFGVRSCSSKISRLLWAQKGAGGIRPRPLLNVGHSIPRKTE